VCLSLPTQSLTDENNQLHRQIEQQYTLMASQSYSRLSEDISTTGAVGGTGAASVGAASVGALSVTSTTSEHRDAPRRPHSMSHASLSTTTSNSRSLAHSHSTGKLPSAAASMTEELLHELRSEHDRVRNVLRASPSAGTVQSQPSPIQSDSVVDQAIHMANELYEDSDSDSLPDSYGIEDVDDGDASSDFDDDSHFSSQQHT
jgi:hypothetical protein